MQSVVISFILSIFILQVNCDVEDINSLVHGQKGNNSIGVIGPQSSTFYWLPPAQGSYFICPRCKVLDYAAAASEEASTATAADIATSAAAATATSEAATAIATSPSTDATATTAAAASTSAAVEVSTEATAATAASLTEEAATAAAATPGDSSIHNAAPMRTGPSHGGGFNSNYNFLWHSDETILNYLTRIPGNEEQAEAPNSSVSTNGHNDGQGQDHGEEEDHFGKLELLFRILAKA